MVLVFAHIGAQAAIVEYHFAGIVASIEDFNGVGYAIPAQLDAPATLTVYVDRDAADTNPDPNSGAYPLAAIGFSFSTGGATLTIQTDPSINSYHFGQGIWVDDNARGYGLSEESCSWFFECKLGDFFSIEAAGYLPDGDGTWVRLGVTLWGPEIFDGLSGDALPDDAPSPAAFRLRQFFIETNTENGTSGIYLIPLTPEEFDSLFPVIPVPPAAYLFASAVGVMGWLRRKATA
jgi:hypothetical protein